MCIRERGVLPTPRRLTLGPSRGVLGDGDKRVCSQNGPCGHGPPELEATSSAFYKAFLGKGVPYLLLLLGGIFHRKSFAIPTRMWSFGLWSWTVSREKWVGHCFTAKICLSIHDLSWPYAPPASFPHYS